MLVAAPASSCLHVHAKSAQQPVHIQPKVLTLETAPGTDTNTNSLWANSIHNSIDDLSRKSRPTLFVPTPSVRVLIGSCLKELVDKIAVCAMYLHTIKPSPINRIAGCFCVPSDIIFNLSLCQRTG